MSFKLNEPAIARLLDSPAGPVGLEIARRAELTTQHASENATGQVIGILSGRLLSGLRFEVQGTPEGVRAIVSTDAVAYNSDGTTRLYHGAPFSYPAFHDRNGRPWLTAALAEVFPG